MSSMSPPYLPHVWPFYSLHLPVSLLISAAPPHSTRRSSALTTESRLRPAWVIDTWLHGRPSRDCSYAKKLNRGVAAFERRFQHPGAKLHDVHERGDDA